MSSVASSHSLSLSAAHKVVKVLALSQQQEASKQKVPTQAISRGEYIAAPKACSQQDAEPVRIASGWTDSAAKQINFYQQHQGLDASSRPLLGLNIDCLL